MDWFEVKVGGRVEEAPGICSFELLACDGMKLPSFSAGAHLEVKVGELIRHYSLVYPLQDEPRYVICVLRECNGRGGSESLCSTLQRGDRLQVRGPHNNFTLLNTKAPVTLLAGGIGITPLICMAEELQRSGRTFTLHYCTRSRIATAFKAVLEEAPYAASVHFHFGDDIPGGLPDIEAMLRDFEPGAQLYVCGPAAMINAATAVAARLGWAHDSVHVERFVAEIPNLGIDPPLNKAFWVELRKSGTKVRVPADRTVVQVLRQVGIRIDISCEAGACGTCITSVVGGIPDHRDSVLTDDEKASNTLFTPCCSRALTEILTLDL